VSNFQHFLFCMRDTVVLGHLPPKDLTLACLAKSAPVCAPVGSDFGPRAHLPGIVRCCANMGCDLRRRTDRRTAAHMCEHVSYTWGSSGRRFKSCQPDCFTSGFIRGVTPKDSVNGSGPQPGPQPALNRSTAAWQVRQ